MTQTLNEGTAEVENQNGTPTLPEKLCILAHDINNGLGIIAGYSQLLLEHPDADENCKRQLRMILATVEQLASRINGHECRMQSCNAKPTQPSEPEHAPEEDRLPTAAVLRH